MQVYNIARAQQENSKFIMNRSVGISFPADLAPAESFFMPYLSAQSRGFFYQPFPVCSGLLETLFCEKNKFRYVAEPPLIFCIVY